MVILEQGNEPIPGYFLSEKLGEGAFGVVWAADGPGETRVALKFLDLQQAGGVKEFQAISAIKNIRHPNLLPITGYWLLDDSGNLISEKQRNRFGLQTANPTMLVIAMVVGEQSLEDVLLLHQNSGASGIPLGELLDYTEDAARGLDFLNAPRHDLGDGRRVSIQHRDVKPDNLLLLGDAAVLCDFGVARACHATSIRTTGLIGSPAFIAPESISGDSSGGASDQYSLALTYYYLRTGRHAVQATNQAAAIQCHVAGELDFSAVHGAEQLVLQRATQITAAARFGSCRDLVRALRSATVTDPCVGNVDRQPDVTATRIDPRFQSTTAAEENKHVALEAAPMRNSQRTGSWRRREHRQGKLLRYAAVAFAIIAFSIVTIQVLEHRNSNAGEIPSNRVKVLKTAAVDDLSERPRLPQDEVTPVLETEPDLQPTIVAGSEAKDSEAKDSEVEGKASDEPVAEKETIVPSVTEPEPVADDTPAVAAKVIEQTAAVEQRRVESLSPEQHAIAALQRLGGTIDRDAHSLDLSGTKLQTQDLLQLEFLPNLLSLSLEHTAIDDEAIEIIARFQPGLRSIFLAGTQVTDLGMKHLVGLQQLVRVDLASCRISDVGIRSLHALENLQAIGLDATQVSSDGMYDLSAASSHAAVIQGPEFSLLGGKRFEVPR